jgi:hypothetical protein
LLFEDGMSVTHRQESFSAMRRSAKVIAFPAPARLEPDPPSLLDEAIRRARAPRFRLGLVLLAPLILIGSLLTFLAVVGVFLVWLAIVTVLVGCVILFARNYLRRIRAQNFRHRAVG